MKVIKNKKYAYFSLAILIAGTLLYLFPPHFSATSAAENTDSQESEWSVNVAETLSLKVTPENEGSVTGNVNEFLRNKITVEVSSNNNDGFTAGMTTKTTDTDLTNETLTSHKLANLATSPKCADANCEAFPANYWGYSLDDASNTGTYHPLVASTAAPITVLKNESGAKTDSADVYFGAKADDSKAAGTYKGTVTFTVTSATKGADLPATGGDTPQPGPSTDDPGSSEDGPSISPDTPTYTYTTDNRTYRTTASSPSVAIVEKNEKKQTTDDSYVAPLGVQDKTYSNVQHGSVITTILMIIALVAAVVGFFFFILAKRREDDEDEQDL